MSYNPNIKWDIIKNNLDKPWDWRGLSYNPNITWDIVQENLDKHWSWCSLSMNPNITWKNVKSNLDKPWDWYALSQNTNILLSTNDIFAVVKQYHSVLVIQKVWRQVISNPEYMICKRRLLHEYNSMDT